MKLQAMQEDVQSKEDSPTKCKKAENSSGHPHLLEHISEQARHRKQMRSSQERQKNLEGDLQLKDAQFSQLAEDEGKAKTKRGQYQTDLNQLNLDKESLQKKKKSMFSRRAQHLRDKVHQYQRRHASHENELVKLIARESQEEDGQSCSRVKGHQAG